ncbi:class I SAM-dependent methyltransferase [Tenacibaculum sp. UWU-22]|uniref:class I SAM-dependent methyltransferase n=1 Tax=Tenacibaculum sp. UWU-22 TaxID=3234187 RepID=UPI0034DB52E4
MEILKRNLNETKTKVSYKKVVWFYDFWSWLTESKAAKYVVKYADVKDGESILEVACGTGLVFKQLVEKNQNGRNIGIDLSLDMLHKAKKKLKDLPTGVYELQEGNVLDLNFDNNTFDLVVNNFMIDLMPYDTFDKIAEEFYRVTKPNGRVVISIFSNGKKKVNRFWYWVAKNFPSILTGCRPVTFKENLVKAGFEIEESIDISQNTFPSEIIKAKKATKI